MASTPIRSFIKGMSWEFISFVLTAIAVYIVYGDLNLSIKFSAALTAVKIGFYFCHERMWKKIRWGKYHIINGKIIVEDTNKERKKKVIEYIKKRMKK